MPIHKQIIHQTKFLGIDFYKRTRIEEHEVQINAQQNITEHPGMVIAGKVPITNSSFTELGSDWAKIAHHTIELTLLDLIINDFIELVLFKDTKSYLDNLIKNEYKNYRLAIKNKYSGKDWLSKSIFQSVKSIERSMEEKAHLRAVIESLLDKYLGGSDTFQFPQKSFVFELIKRYTPNNSWMISEVRTVFFRKRLKLEIIPQKREEFKNAYKILAQIRKTLQQESPEFRRYTSELNEIIEAEFAKRKSSN